MDPSFVDILDDAVYLTRYYIAARYPDDLPEKISDSEAREAFEAACRIRDFVRCKVGELPTP